MVTHEIGFYENISYGIVRMECMTREGDTIVGTGFVFTFRQTAENFIPAIVTNKHVVEGAVTALFRFTKLSPEGHPSRQSHLVIRALNFKNQWINHPDEKVDLCIIPLNLIINFNDPDHEEVYIRASSMNHLPNEEELQQFDSLEEVIMVGYPRGLYDTQNNMPIFRKGITATSIRFDFCGRPDFLIDTAVFEGSSGSPVFVIKRDYKREGGSPVYSQKLWLVGVAHSVYIYTDEENFKQVPIANMKKSALANIPVNLGAVVRYDKIKDFEKVIEDIYFG